MLISSVGVDILLKLGYKVEFHDTERKQKISHVHDRENMLTQSKRYGTIRFYERFEYMSQVPDRLLMSTEVGWAFKWKRIDKPNNTHHEILKIMKSNRLRAPHSLLILRRKLRKRCSTRQCSPLQKN